MHKLGYGFLRLPLLDAGDDTSVDLERVCALVDRYLALGGHCFDTAQPYHGGMSEVALRKCVVERYARDLFAITDKLTIWKVDSRHEMNAFFRGSWNAVVWTFLTPICFTD